MFPAINDVVPEWTEIIHSTFWTTAKINGKRFGIATALSAGTIIRPPFKGNLPPAAADKLHKDLAPICLITAFQQASRTSVVRPQMKQAESAIDQLGNRPLEGIPTNSNRAIVITVFKWNTQTQVEMGLLPVAPFWNPFIIKQSRETRVFSKVSIARHQVESILSTRTPVMTGNIRTAAEPQQDVMIKSAEAS